MSAPGGLQPLDHYCMTCRHGLNRWMVDGVVFYAHTGAYQGPEHEPAPVPRDELLQVHMVCDFCNQPDPRWSLLFANSTVEVAAEDVSVTSRMGQHWAACAQCAVNVEAKDLTGLVRRALRQFKNTPIDPQLAAGHLREAYGAILPTYQGKVPLPA